MAMEIMNTQKNFLNPTLNKNTQRVLKIADAIETSKLTLAAIFVETQVAYDSDATVLTSDGFKSVGEWAKSTFGLAKDSTYNLIRIGSKFVKPIYNAAGVASRYVCALEYADGTTADFSYTQLTKFLPYVTDETGKGKGRSAAKKADHYAEIVELVKNNELRPDMSSREIEKFLSEKFGKNADTKGKGKTKAEKESENGETINPDDDEKIQVKDATGTLYSVPRCILERYRVIAAIVDTTGHEYIDIEAAKEAVEK